MKAKRRKPPGPKPKLTRRLIRRICAVVSRGNTQRVAALTCGIGETTFYRWLEEADNGNELAREFRESLKRATSEAEKRMAGLIQKAATENWQAAAWYLERRNPDDWGRKDRVRQEVTGVVGAPPVQTQEVPIDPNHLQEAYKEKIRRELLAEQKQE